MEFLETREPVSTVYEPREDSFLLLEALSELNLEGLRILDVGTGSGILAAYCAMRGAEVMASDIDSEAIQALTTVSRRLRINVSLVACDLFARIDEQFDLVVFNPPYLPSELSGMGDPAVDGGLQGAAVLNRFLCDLDQHLSEHGYGMFLASSLNKPDSIPQHHQNLDFEVVRQRRMFFETLYVFRVNTKTAKKRAAGHHPVSLQVKL